MRELDLGAVTFLGCVAASELLFVHNVVTDAGGRVVIVHAAPAVRRLLDLTDLTHTFGLDAKNDDPGGNSRARTRSSAAGGGDPAAREHRRPADGALAKASTGAGVLRRSVRSKQRGLELEVDDLRRRGFVGGFSIEPRAIPPAVCCRSCGPRHFPHRDEVHDVRRCSDGHGRGDMDFFALSCPRCHTRGILVAAEPTARSTAEAALTTVLIQRAARNVDLGTRGGRIGSTRRSNDL